MNNKTGYPWLKRLTLLVLALLAWLFSQFPYFVETWYSTAIYPWLAAKMRYLLHFIPFSIGDILYAVAALWLIKTVVKLAVKILNKRFDKVYVTGALRRNLNRVLGIYLFFNLAWGLNYDRLGIAYQLKITPQPYDTTELKALTGSLLQKVNGYRAVLARQQRSYPSYQQVFGKATEAYKAVADTFPFLRYTSPSIKRSMYGKAGNYLGFLGYLNPFTGESQVNVTAPPFLLPYVTCHEVAHQLGYGSESEANFTGYLAAKQSSDPFFNYSVYFDLFNYANNELFYRDSLAARANYRQLDTLVKLDMKTYRDYQRRYKNPVEPLIKIFYNNYLKINDQARGIESYNEVVGWLIAYQKKYGHI
ncbi:DUF3810 domain-containing protein [Foetidibacter luteolus]|uniref:DUF3810 domain-containing protein n=1 Tax=Foetidibacter luteolus TaxID=2608880 RepID=UPI00129B9A76|nr:DUF3810 domain-containing protein [Foetidibacter luteolus]